MFSCFVFTRDQKRKEKKSSDEESESEDDPVKLQKKRDWDEWKDGRRKVCWLQYFQGETRKFWMRFCMVHLYVRMCSKCLNLAN